MSVWRFTNNSRITRRVVVESDADITVTDALGAWFGVQRIRTGREPASLDAGSPRRQRTDLIRYRGGALAPPGGPLRAGDRVELESSVFELVGAPRQIKLGRILMGFEAPVLPVERLYPFVGQLQEQGGVLVTADVRFSAFSVDEAHLTTGTYEDFDAETGLEHYSEAKINRQLVSGSKIFKITSAEVDTVGGFVKMTVRKSGAS